eukprot:12480165-Heterocapsa_arctica.AAC.1
MPPLKVRGSWQCSATFTRRGCTIAAISAGAALSRSPTRPSMPAALPLLAAAKDRCRDARSLMLPLSRSTWSPASGRAAPCLVASWSQVRSSAASMSAKCLRTVDDTSSWLVARVPSSLRRHGCSLPRFHLEPPPQASKVLTAFQALAESSPEALKGMLAATLSRKAA